MNPPGPGDLSGLGMSRLSGTAGSCFLRSCGISQGAGSWMRRLSTRFR